jgi:hypothetical protein
MISGNEFNGDKAYIDKSPKTLENLAYKYTLESVRQYTEGDKVHEIRSIPSQKMALDILVQDHKRLSDLLVEFGTAHKNWKKYVDRIPSYKKFIIIRILKVNLDGGLTDGELHGNE